MISNTSTCTASLNRNDEWNRCCAEAAGFEWVDYFGDDDKGDDTMEEISDHIFHVTNLLDDDSDNNLEDGDGCKEFKVQDAWTVNAYHIQSDLNRMSHWIQSKKQNYVGLDMRDEEAALIQSTVTSFAATTASELETLRNMITSYENSRIINNNLSNHRSGIVQILLDQLQEQVTKPFGILQKQRSRVAVQLWQNPLQCKLYQPKRVRGVIGTSQRPQDFLFDGDDEDQLEHEKEQRFLPKLSYHDSNNGYDFISKYTNKQPTSVSIKQPYFLARIAKRQCLGTGKNHLLTPPLSQPQETTHQEQTTYAHMSSSSDSDLPEKFQSLPPQRENQQEINNKTDEFYQQQLEEELQTESVQLATTLIANNDLDSVQQMETRMVEITTLIGQFSNLVQGQKEQVLQVHDSAKETKDNLDKGQENLIDATERTRKSKHYKAWLILSLAMVLMFFHLLRN